MPNFLNIFQSHFMEIYFSIKLFYLLYKQIKKYFLRFFLQPFNYALFAIFFNQLFIEHFNRSLIKISLDYLKELLRELFNGVFADF